MKNRTQPLPGLFQLQFAGPACHLYGSDDPVYYKMRKAFGQKPDLASPEQRESL